MTSVKKTLYFIKESIPFILLLFFALIISSDARYSSVALDGIKTYCACVLPTLFPFLFLTSAITRLSFTAKLEKPASSFTRKIFGTGGATGYALLISLISGCPVGAKIVSDLKLSGLIGDEESERASVFCSNLSPAYLIAGVGTVSFSSPLFGVSLFLLHLLSVMITGFLFSVKNRKRKPDKIQRGVFKRCGAVINDSAVSAVTSVLTAGAFITVFYIFTEILFSMRLLSFPALLFSIATNSETLGRGVAIGLIECTRGIKTLSTMGICFYSMPLCLFLSGFGGLSFIAQSVAFLKNSKIKTAPYLLSRAVTAVIGFILGLIYSAIFF